ncbi:LOW QUALITY PROTEIN: uridine phosphorylase 2 [Aquila chrysaetos chrysaetos]|uniref:LOW QUALITY PROTEIN: uridine phosphorylase 2 n=1 Tax=Aquila chrysaetos chrysaetos TaxID=223781 RepID=UPI00117704CE|nr:LOW QUALITY PROTEIN: uridine phosphorylase 2 [Aquila chrysaetos chrysaetos]
MTKTTDYSGSEFVQVKNPHSDTTEENVLYHLDLGTKTHNLPAMFGDIKLVCVGSSPNRMRAFAQFMHKQLGLAGDGEDLADIRAGTDRCAMYRAGPVLSISHGMGIPSISIMLQEELIKLLHRAKCRDVTIIRIGTSGGLGIEARSVVITDVAVDSSFQLVVLGDVVVRSTELDKDLVGELLACSKEIPDLPTLVGHTMCTYDFYKGQGRLDRALCSFSSGKKREYLKRAYDTGTRNTETESSAFAALCGLCGPKGESSRGRFHVLPAPPCSPASPHLRLPSPLFLEKKQGEWRAPAERCCGQHLPRGSCRFGPSGASGQVPKEPRGGQREQDLLAFPAGQCFKARVREVVCTALLDRLEGDQIRAPREEVLREYQQRPQRLIAAFVRKHLGLSSPVGNTLFSTN